MHGDTFSAANVLEYSGASSYVWFRCRSSSKAPETRRGDFRRLNEAKRATR